jgi:hypothetical protein
MITMNMITSSMPSLTIMSQLLDVFHVYSSHDPPRLPLTQREARAARPRSMANVARAEPSRAAPRRATLIARDLERPPPRTSGWDEPCG